MLLLLILATAPAPATTLVPYEVVGYRRLSVFDYHEPVKDAAGRPRVYPEQDTVMLDAKDVKPLETMDPFMNAALVFNHHLIQDALSLTKAGFGNAVTEKILDVWYGTNKVMVRSQGSRTFYNWDSFMEGKTELYLGSPYQVKFLLPDGALGEAVSFDQAISEAAPAISIQLSSAPFGVHFTHQNTAWSQRITRVKVSATELWPFEYTINDHELIIHNRDRFMTGENRLEIHADGYRTFVSTVVIP